MLGGHISEVSAIIHLGLLSKQAGLGRQVGVGVVVSLGVGVRVIAGHLANSQLGPVSPTELPSEQSLAIAGQANCLGLLFAARKYPPVKVPSKIITAIVINKIHLFFDTGLASKLLGISFSGRGKSV